MEAITVVIPTRNRQDLLRLTLTSVLRQRNVDLHVIVVDDGSTEDIASAVPHRADSRVAFLRNDHARGVSAARNRGLSEARTTWVGFCDDDDLWSPDKVWQQLAAARSLGRDWAYAGCVYVNTPLRVQGGAPPLPSEEMMTALPRYNAMPAGASNVIARTDLLRRVGGFDAALTHLPDWDLWLRLSRHGPPACVPAPLVGYRSHAANASLRTSEMLAELDGFERRHGLVTDRARFHRHLAHLCLRSGRRRAALSHFARALLRFRDGYSAADLVHDGYLVRAHAAEIGRRRIGRWLPGAMTEGPPAGRQADPNAAWKAQAQAWLDELPGEDGDARSR